MIHCLRPNDGWIGCGVKIHNLNSIGGMLCIPIHSWELDIVHSWDCGIIHSWDVRVVIGAVAVV
jgi:hypothetical protein